MAQYKMIRALEDEGIKSFEDEVNGFLFLINWLKYSLVSINVRREKIPTGQLGVADNFNIADIIYESRGRTIIQDQIMSMDRDKIKKESPEIKERLEKLAKKHFGD